MGKGRRCRGAETDAKVGSTRILNRGMQARGYLARKKSNFSQVQRTKTGKVMWLKTVWVVGREKKKRYSRGANYKFLWPLIDGD